MTIKIDRPAQIWAIIYTEDGRYLPPFDCDEGAMLVYPTKKLAEKGLRRQAKLYDLDAKGMAVIRLF